VAFVQSFGCGGDMGKGLGWVLAKALRSCSALASAWLGGVCVWWWGLVLVSLLHWFNWYKY